jgi:ADP-heptose:LPS heptosyltransferase
MKFIQIPAKIILNYILRVLNIFVIYRVGHAVGDQLCMSAVIRLIDQQFSFKIIVISSFPELFYNNPRVWKNFKLTVNGYGPLIVRILRFLAGKNLANFLFTNPNIKYEEYMREIKSPLHLVEANSLHFKINLNFDFIANEIYFSQKEIIAFTEKFKLPSSYSVIQPNSKTSYTPNKQWGFQKYQKVIAQLKNITWIQIGVTGDLLLNDVENYVGKTSLRELAFIIKNANFVIADEGLLNHMASSVGSISYVVYSGFHPIEISKYEKTISIVNNPQVECSPCWITETCPKKIKYCTEQISIEQVINEIK